MNTPPLKRVVRAAAKVALAPTVVMVCAVTGLTPPAATANPGQLVDMNAQCAAQYPGGADFRPAEAYLVAPRDAYSWRCKRTSTSPNGGTVTDRPKVGAKPFHTAQQRRFAPAIGRKSRHFGLFFLDRPGRDQRVACGFRQDQAPLLQFALQQFGRRLGWQDVEQFEPRGDFVRRADGPRAARRSARGARKRAARRGRDGVDASGRRQRPRGGGRETSLLADRYDRSDRIDLALRTEAARVRLRGRSLANIAYPRRDEARPPSRDRLLRERI